MGYLEENFLGFLVIFLAALFLILVLMTIISFCLPDSTKHSSYINGKKKEIKVNTKRHEYYDPKPIKEKNKGKEKDKVSDSLSFKSHSYDTKNNIPNEKLESTAASDSDSRIDSNENDPSSQIQNSLNDDGTVRTEINFVSPIDNCPPKQSSKKYEYLETANNGRFRKLLPTDEKSFFRTWIENGTRLFEFYGNVDKALANINAIFDDVCEIEGKRNGASQIINKKPGVLDSNLSIEKKAIIKLL